jgi:hypothetical protein
MGWNWNSYRIIQVVPNELFSKTCSGRERKTSGIVVFCIHIPGNINPDGCD